MSSKRRDESKKPRGGKGSNQYTVRGRSVSDTDADESRAAFIEKMKGLDPVSADTSGDRQAHILVDSLDKAITDSQNDGLSEEQAKGAKIAVRAAENDIYNSYPYSYASAMVNSTYSEHPVLDGEEGSSTNFDTTEELRDNYDRVRLDATGTVSLSEEQLVESLNAISELEARVRNEEYDKKDAAISNGIAAKVVSALRSGVSQEKLNDLGDKINDYRDRRLSHVGF